MRSSMRSEAENETTRLLLRTFLDQEDLSTAQAAEKLGIPRRTAENILQRRGFAYPRLLELAIERLESNKGADEAPL